MSKGVIYILTNPSFPQYVKIGYADNVAKAIGLAEFADKHQFTYNRIQLIRKKMGADRKDHFYRLDMAKMQVRNKVKAITDNADVDV